MSYQQGGYNSGQADAGQQYSYQAAPPYASQSYPQAPQQGVYSQPQQPFAPHSSYAPDAQGAYAGQTGQFPSPQHQAGAQQPLNSGAYGSSPPTQGYASSTGPPQGYAGGAQSAPQQQQQQQQQHRLGAPPPANGMTVAPPLNYPPAPFRYNRKGSGDSHLPRLSSDNGGGYSTYGAPAAKYPDSGSQQWGMQAQPQQYAPPPPY